MSTNILFFLFTAWWNLIRFLQLGKEKCMLACFIINCQLAYKKRTTRLLCAEHKMKSVKKETGINWSIFLPFLRLLHTVESTWVLFSVWYHRLLCKCFPWKMCSGLFSSYISGRAVCFRFFKINNLKGGTKQQQHCLIWLCTVKPDKLI